MSIPPLVCNTPPPPDQCEDDKDTEDFDIPYNLSQEDDDIDYAYGEFSTYNISTSQKQHMHITHEQKIEIKTIDNLNDVDKDLESNNTKETIIDNNISNKLDALALNTENCELDEEIKTINKGFEENTIHDTELCCDPMPTAYLAPSDDNVLVDKMNINSEPNNMESTVNIIKENALDTSDVNLNQHNIQIDSTKGIKNDDIDDFDDFDHFQTVTNNIPITSIDNCDNPWENEQTDDSDFSNFKANFDENNSINTIPTVEQTEEDQVEQNDSDFGDFNDFKSSAVNNTESAEFSYQCCNEEQMAIGINQVLENLFKDEITECEEGKQAQLETFLCETWGHLVDVDIRQPYIISWNNSLSQKTLLRALCIDSRNILFASKWNYSVPKYATNLSTAPLQPQKATTSIASAESSVSKLITKPTDSWVDPFKADGKESCNSETSTPISAPTQPDLSIFESTPAKGNIYSSTIGLQPIRQINLPDTHIFTPTDSETPRSKTIHYDSPPVLLPQPSKIDISLKETIESRSNNTALDDSDYSDFQDFKGTTTDFNVQSTTQTVDLPTTKENITPNLAFVESTPIKQEQTNDSRITYQTQILQPVKVDPIIPTINWPDPGEIKETFEDFSDFVSNSSWPSNEQISVSLGTGVTNTPEVNATLPNSLQISNIPNDTDDDFDTFQSAVSVTKNVTTASTAPSASTMQPFSLEVLTKTSTSFASIKSNDIFTHNYNSDVSKSSTTILNSIPSIQPTYQNSLSSNILSPLPSFTQPNSHQQRSGQILQPLSLESFSQINLPNSGMDLSKFNPVESLPSLKGETMGNNSKNSPLHQKKNQVVNHLPDDDIWGDFVSSKPKQSVPAKPAPSFVDDDEWTDFVSSPSVKAQNGLNTISFNVHTNNIQKAGMAGKLPTQSAQVLGDIPSLNYVTPKSTHYKHFNDKHFQNL